MSEKNVSMLVRIGAIFLGVATLLLVAFIVSEVKSYQYIGSDAAEEATISVSGEGEVFAKPDTAVFRVTVKEEADTVPEAQKEATEKINKVIAFLTDQGIEKEDIKTTSYRIYPRYDYERPRIGAPAERVLEAYVVSQGLEVKVQNADTAGDVLSGVGSLAVSNVSGLHFTVDNEEAVKDKARSEAIKDAKEKAGALAGSLGVDLVQVIGFHESAVGVNPPVYYQMAGMKLAADTEAVSPQIPQGENKFTSHVTITYKIK